jgi:hypothetical protein
MLTSPATTSDELFGTIHPRNVPDVSPRETLTAPVEVTNKSPWSSANSLTETASPVCRSSSILRNGGGVAHAKTELFEASICASVKLGNLPEVFGSDARKFLIFRVSWRKKRRLRLKVNY